MKKEFFYSDVSGELLGTSGKNFETNILSATEYPELKNKPENIVLMTDGERLLYTSKPKEAKKLENFSNIFARAEILKKSSRTVDNF